MAVLRDLLESDIPAFFEHQQDPEAARRWRLSGQGTARRSTPTGHASSPTTRSLKKTIVFEGQVAGNIGSWPQDGRQLVSYWLGKEFGAKDSRRRPSPS